MVDMACELGELIEATWPSNLSKLLRAFSLWGLIRIISDFKDSHHELAVQNSGKLNGYSSIKDDGFGIRSTQDRLNLLYQGKAHFEIREIDGGMVESRIIMPTANIL